jgi:uncharacterized membrane protein
MTPNKRRRPVSLEGYSQSTDTAFLVYVLYLMSVITGVTAFIGAGLIFFEQGKKIHPWVQSHYFYQLHTLWKSLVFFMVGFLLAFVYIGIVVLLFSLGWFVARCIRGLILLQQKRPIPNPHTWWI